LPLMAPPPAALNSHISSAKRILFAMSATILTVGYVFYGEITNRESISLYAHAELLLKVRDALERSEPANERIQIDLKRLDLDLQSEWLKAENERVRADLHDANKRWRELVDADQRRESPHSEGKSRIKDTNIANIENRFVVDFQIEDRIVNDKRLILRPIFPHACGFVSANGLRDSVPLAKYPWLVGLTEDKFHVVRLYHSCGWRYAPVFILIDGRDARGEWYIWIDKSFAAAFPINFVDYDASFAFEIFGSLLRVESAGILKGLPEDLKSILLKDRPDNVLLFPISTLEGSILEGAFSATGRLRSRANVYEALDDAMSYHSREAVVLGLKAGTGLVLSAAPVILLGLVVLLWHRMRRIRVENEFPSEAWIMIDQQGWFEHFCAAAWVLFLLLGTLVVLRGAFWINHAALPGWSDVVLFFSFFGSRSFELALENLRPWAVIALFAGALTLCLLVDTGHMLLRERRQMDFL